MQYNTITKNIWRLKFYTKIIKSALKAMHLSVRLWIISNEFLFSDVLSVAHCYCSHFIIGCKYSHIDKMCLPENRMVITGWMKRKRDAQNSALFCSSSHKVENFTSRYMYMMMPWHWNPLRKTDLHEENALVTGGFPLHMASDALIVPMIQFLVIHLKFKYAKPKYVI